MRSGWGLDDRVAYGSYSKLLLNKSGEWDYTGALIIFFFFYEVWNSPTLLITSELQFS